MDANRNLRDALINFFLADPPVLTIEERQDQHNIIYQRAIPFFRSVAWLYRDKIFDLELWRRISVVWAQIGGFSSLLSASEFPGAIHPIPVECYDSAIALIIGKVCLEFSRRQGPIQIDLRELLNAVFFENLPIFGDNAAGHYRRLAKINFNDYYHTCEDAIYRLMPLLELQHQVQCRHDAIQEIYDEQQQRMGVSRAGIGSLSMDIVQMLKDIVREKIYSNRTEYVGPTSQTWAQNKILRTRIDPDEVRAFFGARF